ncbi:NAD(P)-binding protein [Massariosphaeria phaeospora]|uniref:NAD(P)-binding protein n=1 Tax=Massariosphaeria phaeospora TaxID=100035 RepID=A0A7C8I7F2_9PLEO|nr:NAD(P)-binding protein [Massariosphaeria phaeospora]
MNVPKFLYHQWCYDPPVPSTSFSGRVVIVTGANSGLGLEACRHIARLGASKIILACRTIEKGKAAATSIQASTNCSADVLDVWKLDMSSYASVQAFTQRANTELPRLDVLIANAGMWASTFRTSEDNEETITTNVVSTALLGFLLHPKLSETARKFGTKTHITITSSELYLMAKFKESKAPLGQIFATLSDEKKSNMADRYNVSKLLVVLLVKQMAALAPLESSAVIVNNVGPGYCKSELGREQSAMLNALAGAMGARTTEVGSRMVVYGATAGSESHGQYVPDCEVKPTGGLTKGKEGEDLQKRVWAELKAKLERIQTGVTDIR